MSRCEIASFEKKSQFWRPVQSVTRWTKMLWKRHKTNENSFDTSTYINECWKGIFEAETDQVSTEVNDEARKAWKSYTDVRGRWFIGRAWFGKSRSSICGYGSKKTGFSLDFRFNYKMRDHH